MKILGSLFLVATVEVLFGAFGLTGWPFMASFAVLKLLVLGGLLSPPAVVFVLLMLLGILAGISRRPRKVWLLVVMFLGAAFFLMPFCFTIDLHSFWGPSSKGFFSHQTGMANGQAINAYAEGRMANSKCMARFKQIREEARYAAEAGNVDAEFNKKLMKLQYKKKKKNFMKIFLPLVSYNFMHFPLNICLLFLLHIHSLYKLGIRSSVKAMFNLNGLLILSKFNFCYPLC